MLVDEAGRVLLAEALVTGARDAAQLAAAGVTVLRPPSGEAKAQGPQADLLRLLTLRGWLDAALARVVPHGPAVAVLEGVGFHRGMSQASVAALYQAHAVARLALADAGLPTEVVPPTTIRDALHGKRLPRGTDGKAATRLAVMARWGHEWPGDGEGDLADAYVLARVG